MVILRGIWSTEVASVIGEVGENKFGISVKTKVLMERVIKEGPWSIIGYCLALARWPKGASTEEVVFKGVEF